MPKKKSLKSKGGKPKLAAARQSAIGSSRSSKFSPGRVKLHSENDYHFSMKDEARNTERSSKFWASDIKLRTRGVDFVSAGSYVAVEAEQLLPAEYDAIETQDAYHPEIETAETRPQVEVDSAKESSLTDTAASRSQGLTGDGLAFTEVGVEPGGQVPPESSGIFVIDTAGDPRIVGPTTAVLHIHSSSPTSSDFSDEVVFRGRSPRARVVDDPFDGRRTAAISSPVGEQAVISIPHWDDTGVEWISRSKPGIGWSVPSQSPRVVQARSLSGFRIPKCHASVSSFAASAADDYLDNIRAHEVETLQATTFVQRELDSNLEEAAVHATLESLSLEDSTATESDTSTMSSERLTRLPVEVPSNLESAGNDDLSERDDDTYNSDAIHGISDDIDDEELAALLAQQEELGIDSDELSLFDGKEADVLRAAKRYSREKPKKCRNLVGSYPSASLLADVLEQDPYNGFDIMDFDRPSLRKRKGKGRPADSTTLLDFSDSDNFMDNTLWENDRQKKKVRKQEREELRAQGLLGKKIAVMGNYGEGMNIWDIGKEFEAFLNSSEQQRAFPPMDKRRRKMVHEIATEFNLKTKSVGQSSSRHTILIRTGRTTKYVEHKFVARARQLNMGFFPRMDALSGQKSTLEQKRTRAARHAGGSGAVRYRDGDVVGGTAPEIGMENKGRAMLERMGWTSGMGLGAGDNIGILQPIAHVVKNSKSGLG